MGRQDLLRAERCRPRRGDRCVGPQGSLRLGSSDLDDPVHGWSGSVERSVRAVVRSRRPADRGARSDRGGHVRVECARWSDTRRSPTTSGRSPSRRGGVRRHDPETETSGVGWIRAVDWVPYQRPTFVTPAFAGYVSGHSTFSRAAAEVMTAHDRDVVLPGRPGRVDHSEGRAAARGGPDLRCRPSSGRPTSTPPIKRASPGSTWASTSRRTTSKDASSAPRSATVPGARAQQYFDGLQTVSRWRDHRDVGPFVDARC